MGVETKRENRITVSLSSKKLLDFLNDEATRQGLDHRKRGVVLERLLSKEYDRTNNPAVSYGVNEPSNEYIESLGDRVAENALKKIELRLKKR